jgi:hypothetical protein
MSEKGPRKEPSKCQDRKRAENRTRFCLIVGLLHPGTQPTVDQKYLKKIMSVLNMYRLFFSLALFPKQYNLTTPKAFVL